MISSKKANNQDLKIQAKGNKMSSTNRSEGVGLAMDSGPSTFIRQAFYAELYKSFKNKPRAPQPLSKHLEKKLDAAIAKLRAEQKSKTPAENG